MGQKNDNVRVWSFLVWKESAPDNWIQILKNHHIPGIISPLHDKDKNDDGSDKKAHWHVILNYSGKKSYEQVQEIAKEISTDYPIRVEDICALTRYITSHIDDPDKAQYDKSESICMGGFDLDKYFEMPKSLIRIYCHEMVQYIIDNNVNDFCVFDAYCHYANENWEYVLQNTHTHYFSTLLKSRNLHAKDFEKTHPVNANKEGIIE